MGITSWLMSTVYSTIGSSSEPKVEKDEGGGSEVKYGASPEYFFLAPPTPPRSEVDLDHGTGNPSTDGSPRLRKRTRSASQSPRKRRVKKKPGPKPKQTSAPKKALPRRDCNAPRTRPMPFALKLTPINPAYGYVPPIRFPPPDADTSFTSSEKTKAQNSLKISYRE